jgi:hypothetical protein
VQGGDAGGVLEGEGEGFLVAVYGEVVGALAWSFTAGFSCVGRVWRTPCTCVVAADGVLDFDDFRSVYLSANILSSEAPSIA